MHQQKKTTVLSIALEQTPAWKAQGNLIHDVLKHLTDGHSI